MSSTAVANIGSRVLPWGNALGLRITKPLALAAGLTPHAAVSISAELGRVVIEVVPEKPTLKQMLAAFDPARHGGEAMAFKPVGKEVL